MVQKRVDLPLGVASEAVAGAGRLFTSENCINMFPEKAKGKALSPFKLVSAPGFALFSDLASSGAVRGARRLGGVQYTVSNEQLYTVDADGVGTARGTIEGTRRVKINWNRTQIGILADSRFYVYDPVTAVAPAQVTDTDLINPIDFDMLDSYGIFVEGETDRLLIGDLADLTSIDGLSFVTAEGTPDKLVGAIVVNGQIAAVGEDTTEFFVNTGDTTTNVFQRSSGAATLDIGGVCRDGMCRYNNGLAMLGREEHGGLLIYHIAGQQERRISSHAVETFLENAGAALVRETILGAYLKNGHLFLVVTIPGYGTRVYDVSSGEWHQRVMDNWPITTPVPPTGDWGGTILCPSADGAERTVGRSDGNLYALDDESYTQDGVPIVREVTLPPFDLGGRSFCVDEVELRVEAGVGTDDGSDDDDPKVLLSYSVDGGKTFVDPFWAELGEMGDYGRRVSFYGLGWCEGAKGIIFRIRCSNAVSFALNGAFITYTQG